MIEELLKAGKINENDLQEYNMFIVSDTGRAWFQRKLIDTFLEQPPYGEITGDNVLFIDGRRAFLREIHFNLERIQKLIREYHNDNTARDEAK